MTVTLDINQFVNKHNEFIFELNDKVKNGLIKTLLKHIIITKLDVKIF